MLHHIHLLWAFLLLGLVSCNVDEYNSYEANSYVLGYRVMTRPVLQVEGNWISVHAECQELIWEYNKKDLFESQNMTHGDQNFRHTVTYVLGEGNAGKIFLYPDFQTIDLLCEEAYDEHHPANSSIADIVTFCSVSSMSHILSGYKEKYRPLDSIGGNSEWLKVFLRKFEMSAEGECEQKVIVCPLSDATAQDLMLLGRDMHVHRSDNPTAYMPFAVLIVNTPPARPGTYHLRLTLLGTDNNTYTATVAYTK